MHLSAHIQCWQTFNNVKEHPHPEECSFTQQIHKQRRNMTEVTKGNGGIWTLKGSLLTAIQPIRRSRARQSLRTVAKNEKQDRKERSHVNSRLAELNRRWTYRRDIRAVTQRIHLHCSDILKERGFNMKNNQNSLFHNNIIARLNAFVNISANV